MSNDLRIFGQLGVSISLGGGSVPLTMGGVKEVLIVQNVKALVPQIKITTLDINGTLHDMRLSDGMQMNVTLDDGISGGQNLRFRMFGDPMVQEAGSALSFSITGMLDAIPFMRQHVSKSYKGTSASVLAQIASEVGFQPLDFTSTNDMMVWLPQPISIAKFVQNIVTHGYKDDSSVMVSAVTEDHSLIYKNLTEEVDKSSRAILFNGEKPSGGRPIPIVHWQLAGQGGVLNHMFGYGTKIIEEKMDGAASILNKYMAQLMNGSLGMAKDLIKQIDTVRNVYVPPDNGNTHEKFTQARYQNLRGAATFVGKIEVITSIETGLNLYDPVETYITLPHVYRVSDVYSTKFLVTAKTRCMRENNQYFEKLELSNQGIGAA